MGLLKMALVAGVAYASLYGQREKVLGLAAMTTPEIAGFLAQILIWTSMKIAMALLLLAVLDYGFQWWKQERDLRMTTQEVREELKNLEANPQMAARRKQVQRQLALHRISSAVPKADAVITNPTELAIAIQYDPQTMAAPIVVAKGAGLIAARIRKLALEHGIPILERKPLAQALYREVEIDHPIPAGPLTPPWPRCWPTSINSRARRSPRRRRGNVSASIPLHCSSLWMAFDPMSLFPSRKSAKQAAMSGPSPMVSYVGVEPADLSVDSGVSRRNQSTRLLHHVPADWIRNGIA